MGLSKSTIARLAGVSRQYISMMYEYRQIKNLQILKKIVSELGIPVELVKECLIEDFSKEISMKWEEME